MPGSEVKNNANKPEKIPPLAVDLVVTMSVTIATSLASMASVALLARILERDEFLSYTLLLRYFSLAIVVLGVGSGFSLIGREGQQLNRTANAALLLQVLLVLLCAGLIPWTLASLWLMSRSDLWPSWTILGYCWVVAHTLFVLSGPFSRARGGVYLYARLALGCRSAPFIAGAGLVFLTGEFMGLFVGFGVVSVFWLWRFWATIGIAMKMPFNWQEAKSLLGFGASRWLDDIVRTLMPVALIVATGFFLSGVDAAVMALVYLVVRVLESMLQPLVISLMMRGRIAASSLSVDILRVAVFSLIFSGTLFALRPVVEQFFVLFLGKEYEDVSALAWLMLMSASAIISLSYLRACYDNRFSNSPVFFINLVFIVIMVSAVMLWCSTVYDVVISVVLVHVGRVFSYSLALFLLLGGKKKADIN